MGNNSNTTNIPDVNEIKSLIDRLMELNGQYSLPDTTNCEDFMGFVRNAKTHNDKITTEINEIKQKLKEYSIVFGTSLGDLIREIMNQIRIEHPNLDVKPKTKILGRYRKAHDTPAGLMMKGYTHQFHGRVQAFIAIENMPPINLGFVYDFFEICHARPFTPDGKLVTRPFKNYNIWNISDNYMDTLHFLTQETNHPCKAQIDKACYNLIDKRIKQLHADNTAEM